MSNYRIIYAETMQNLVTLVNLALEQGWICQGGVCTDGVEFWQAVVKP